MDVKLDDDKVLKKAKLVVSNYHLCDHCLGRLFGKIEHGLTNDTRGKTIRSSLPEEEQIPPEECQLCEGLLGEIQDFADLVMERLEEYEFDTFLVGSKVDEDIANKEERVWDEFEVEFGEPIKMEINREIGKIVEDHLDAEVDFSDPDITAVVDTAFGVVDLQVKSLYIYGRYMKKDRGIPQTKWVCRVCRGVGCKKCDYTGTLYDTSVEELIAEPVVAATEGGDEAFHGCGREDVDALMLGEGRPFVLEIKDPVKRKPNLSVLEKQINEFAGNKVRVKNLRFSDKNEVVRLKQADFKKTYRIVFQGKKAINKEKLNEAARILQGETVRQRTPQRVAHRRADRIRKRKIHECKVDSVSDNRVALIIKTDPGTYVKEVVSGDAGRTQPNVSKLLDIPCEVTTLDVLEVEGD